MFRRIIVTAAVVAALLSAAPAATTVIRPDVRRGPEWTWGKCRHDPAWGGGRYSCRIVRVGSR